MYAILRFSYMDGWIFKEISHVGIFELQDGNHYFLQIITELMISMEYFHNYKLSYFPHEIQRLHFYWDCSMEIFHSTVTRNFYGNRNQGKDKFHFIMQNSKQPFAIKFVQNLSAPRGNDTRNNLASK